MTGHVLISGVSTRAAAESAARAGFEVTAIDAFGDLDQHGGVRSLSIPRDAGARFTARAAAKAAREIRCDAVAYLSPFENHPRAVESLARGRSLWGNPSEVLRRVRDPFLLAGTLRRQGFSTPLTRVDVPPELAGVKEWLVKPFRSGGGQGVRRWQPDAPVTPGCYAQEHIEGIPASMVFVAARGRAVPLGVSYQIIGDAALGASGFRYCGNVLAPAADPLLTDQVTGAAGDLASHLATEFELVGLNGIDFIVRDGIAYAIEVNPRWSSSMELVERAYGISMFAVHVAACVDDALPAFDLSRARSRRPATGKAIVFAREEVNMGDTRAWLEDDTVRDVPKPGEHIEAGQPICTVFAQNGDVDTCRARLRHRAALITSAVVVTIVLALFPAGATAQASSPFVLQNTPLFAVPAGARL